MSNYKTHEVLDLLYHPEERHVYFVGTQQECEDFVATQSPTFMYKVVPMTLNAYLNDDHKNLQRTDLGDIERENSIYQMKVSKEQMDLIESPPVDKQEEKSIEQIAEKVYPYNNSEPFADERAAFILGYKANTINKELLEALKGLMELRKFEYEEKCYLGDGDMYKPQFEKAEVAISKAEQQLKQ